MENLSIAVEEWELYNNGGILLCKWFDQETDIEEIYEYVKEAKRLNGLNSDDLELFMADWENDFLGIITENSNIEEVFNTYNNLDLDDDQIESLSYLTDSLNYSVEEAINKVDDLEVYDYDNFKDLAWEFIDQGLFGEIPPHLENYLDVDAMASDLSFDYDLHNGRIYRVA